MKKRILSVLLCLSMAVGLLTGCGDKSSQTRSDSADSEEVTVAEETIDDWKEYCLDGAVINHIKSSDNNANYGIFDIDNNGIPEILVRSRSNMGVDGFYSLFYSFYDFINDYDLSIDKPEVTVVASGDDIYIYNNNIITIKKLTGTRNSDGTSRLEEIFIDTNYPSTGDNDRLCIYNETDPVNHDIYLDVFDCLYAYSDKNLSETGAYSKASEFLGTDITSLPKTEVLYTFDELIEKLKDYDSSKVELDTSDTQQITSGNVEEDTVGYSSGEVEAMAKAYHDFFNDMSTVEIKYAYVDANNDGIPEVLYHTRYDGVCLVYLKKADDSSYYACRTDKLSSIMSEDDYNYTDSILMYNPNTGVFYGNRNREIEVDDEGYISVETNTVYKYNDFNMNAITIEDCYGSSDFIEFGTRIQPISLLDTTIDYSILNEADIEDHIENDFRYIYLSADYYDDVTKYNYIKGIFYQLMQIQNDWIGDSSSYYSVSKYSLNDTAVKVSGDTQAITNKDLANYMYKESFLDLFDYE